MININLITQEQKEILKNQRFYFSLKEASILLFLFFLTISLILWISYYIMGGQLLDLKKINDLNSNGNEGINQRLENINNQVDNIINIQDNFTYNHLIIEKISSLRDSKITYDQIIVQNQQNILELYGTAENRESLLNFKRTLESQDWLDKIDLPLANLIEKENNQFKIKMEIIKDRL